MHSSRAAGGLGLAATAVVFAACKCAESPAVGTVLVSLSAESPIRADGATRSQLVARAVDGASSTPVAGRAIVFRSERGAVDEFEQPADPTDAEGFARGTVRSRLAGVAKISLLLDGVEPSATADVLFTQVGCVSGSTRKCYEGPSATRGQGLCRAGTQVCDNGDFGPCIGQILPAAETCDNQDEDCNGAVDSGVPPRPCYTGPAGTLGKGVCLPGTESCANGVWSACQGQVTPDVESCNGRDDNCDGSIDEGCACTDGSTQACYSGPSGTAGVWPCRGGTQTCAAGTWGACAGEVVPQAETCNNADDDCDGAVDDGVTQSCYTGPAGTGGVGVCRSGTQACSAGAFGPCAGEVRPAAESCNGVDDDCDGTVDEGCACVDGTTQSCYGGPAGTAGVGACRAGTQVCGGGGWGACQGEVLPTAEACNNVDDDCDGSIDEALTRACYGGPAGTAGVGACRAGTQVCGGGAWGACQGEVTPTAEICDGLDQDCNGTPDDAIAARPCYSGPAGTQGIGICSGGTQPCAGGVWGPCQGEVTPAAEACNNIDDNCNGVVDDGLSRTCYTGPAGTQGVGICQAGTETCSGGAWGACQGQVTPGTESCNNLDDDCDTQIDESVSRACYTGDPATRGVGACRDGTQTCSAGTFGACLGEGLPATETCNNVDDDCDTLTDEGLSRACYTGDPATRGVGECRDGTETCSAGAWGACLGQVLPATEACDGVKDEDCNGAVDNGCACVNGTTQACWTGLASQRNVGRCRDGTQTCSGGAWGPCQSEIGPVAETCNGVDDDCNGVVDDASITGPQCNDGNVCNGTETCSGGACQPGTPPALSVSSSFTATSACLTAGTAAESGAVLDLRDTNGSRVSGATVTIGSSNPAFAFVEPAAVESAAVPGVYYRTLRAAASAPASTTLSASATWCGNTVAMSTTRTVTAGVPNATAGGGLGGCAPPDGHVQVKVVRAETPATAIAGANVMVGAAAGNPFVTSTAALVAGSPPAGPNTGTTDANGLLDFQDFGTALDGAVTVTAVFDDGTPAGARAYATFYGSTADDLVIPLERINPPAVPLYDYTAGTGSANNNAVCDSWYDAGLVSVQTNLDRVAAFDFTGLLGSSVCRNLGALPGSQMVPENIWAPGQTVFQIFLCVSLNPVAWDLRRLTGGNKNFSMVFGRIPVSVLTSNPTSTQILRAFQARELGFRMNQSVTANVTGFNIPLDDDYPNTFSIQFSNQPTQTDLIGLNVGDYAGGNGTGDLFVISYRLRAYDSAATSIVVANSDLNAGTSPSTARRVAAVVATYLDPVNTANRTVAANRAGGISTVLMRNAVGSTNPPVTAAGGQTLNTTDHGGFLDVSGADPNATNTTFSFDDATRGSAPHWSRSDLEMVHTLYRTPIPCAGTTQPNPFVTTRPQWTVVKPFDVNCGTRECFTLPTLPGAWPRASTGTQKQSGFEQRIGSGLSCTSNANCISGETCMDADSNGTTECAGTDPATGRPFIEKDRWRLGIDRHGLNAFYNYATMDLANRRRDLTHISGNTRTFTGQ